MLRSLDSSVFHLWPDYYCYLSIHSCIHNIISIGLYDMQPTLKKLVSAPLILVVRKDTKGRAVDINDVHSCSNLRLTMLFGNWVADRFPLMSKVCKVASWVQCIDWLFRCSFCIDSVEEQVAGELLEMPLDSTSKQLCIVDSVKHQMWGYPSCLPSWQGHQSLWCPWSFVVTVPKNSSSCQVIGVVTKLHLLDNLICLTPNL